MRTDKKEKITNKMTFNHKINDKNDCVGNTKLYVPKSFCHIKLSFFTKCVVFMVHYHRMRPKEFCLARPMLALFFRAVFALIYLLR